MVLERTIVAYNYVYIYINYKRTNKLTLHRKNDKQKINVFVYISVKECVRERARKRERECGERIGVVVSFPPNGNPPFLLSLSLSFFIAFGKINTPSPATSSTRAWKEDKKHVSRGPFYFFMVAGMRASMGLPSAASFSISTRRATPSQTNWRRSTSE